MKKINPADIVGWGVDIDPANNPTYPMRDVTRDEKGGMNWARPTQQQSHVEVLHSTERPTLSAVYGTSMPPHGLSGILRRWAFKKSEGKWGHWLILLFADRINVAEGIIDDFLNGHFPNIPAEMGMRAEYRLNRSGFFRKLFYAFVILVLIVILAVQAVD